MQALGNLVTGLHSKYFKEMSKEAFLANVHDMARMKLSESQMKDLVELYKKHVNEYVMSCFLTVLHYFLYVLRRSL